MDATEQVRSFLGYANWSPYYPCADPADSDITPFLSMFLHISSTSQLLLTNTRFNYCSVTGFLTVRIATSPWVYSTNHYCIAETSTLARSDHVRDSKSKYLDQVPEASPRGPHIT